LAAAEEPLVRRRSLWRGGGAFFLYRGMGRRTKLFRVTEAIGGGAPYLYRGS